MIPSTLVYQVNINGLAIANNIYLKVVPFGFCLVKVMLFSESCRDLQISFWHYVGIWHTWYVW